MFYLSFGSKPAELFLLDLNPKTALLTIMFRFLVRGDRADVGLLLSLIFLRFFVALASSSLSKLLFEEIPLVELLGPLCTI